MGVERLVYERKSVLSLVLKDSEGTYKKKRPEQEKLSLLKRISLDKLMDLKIDYAFKQLFGSEKNKDITIEFVNAFLQKSGRDKVKEVEFLNIEIAREYEEDKESRLDLLIVTDNMEKINVEIQFTNKYDTVNRTLYYWSGVYRSNLKRGMDYFELIPVISINILNYDMISDIETFHTIFHLRESERHRKLTEMLEIHFIEMPKLLYAWKKEELDPWNDVLARWLLLLGMVDSRRGKVYDDIYKELEAIAVEDKALGDAFSHWHDLSLTEEEFLAYEARLKKIMDEEAYRTQIRRREERIKEMEAKNKEMEAKNKEMEAKNKEMEARNKEIEAKNKKMQEELMQREEALQKKHMQIVTKFVNLGLNNEEISQHTGLSEFEISEIIKKMDT